MGTRLLVHNLQRSLSHSIGKSSENGTLNIGRAFSTSSSSKKNELTEVEVASRHTEEFETPSPYKQPGPRRFGYVPEHKTQGCLPRDDMRVKSMPAYKAKKVWDTKAALFGQNDYIDILGDGQIHPSDLLTGPPWLLGFKGNERERLLRKMEWMGKSMKVLYPAEYNRCDKRIRYLTKLYNTKRHLKKKD